MAKIRPSGGYRELRSFQAATVIYDATYWFCEKFLDPRSRMADQMVQAARSGRQNIAEGSRASATSSQTELRLMNVARASLEELLLDYEDYLRHRRLARWKPDSADAIAVRDAWRGIADRTDRTDRTAPADADARHFAVYARWLDNADPGVRANALICLINQANTLLDRQIEALETEFVEQGGYSEQLAAARLNHRRRARETTGDPIPPCPECSKPLVLRTAKSGKNAGRQFWGCSAYPDCRGVVDV
ncbi:MAG: four helix bundle suffix domain-containing protein [Planctomycetota bacterium]